MLKIQLFLKSLVGLSLWQIPNITFNETRFFFFFFYMTLIHGLLCKTHIIKNSQSSVGAVKWKVFVFVHMRSRVSCGWHVLFVTSVSVVEVLKDRRRFRVSLDLLTAKKSICNRPFSLACKTYFCQKILQLSLSCFGRIETKSCYERTALLHIIIYLLIFKWSELASP